AAAQRTQQIRLGTGVTSLPYHHPFMVADKMTLLDHLTRGRAMLGVGPGLLASDAYMIGIDPTEQRRMMNESLDAVMRLLRGETVTMKTDWFELHEARVQLPPYSSPHLPVAVATSFTPSGPVAAGRHGLGLLSVAGAGNEGFDRTWGWVEEAAAEHGQTVSRADWRVVVSIHLAETREQAIADLEAGFARRAYAMDGPNPGGSISFGPTGRTIAEALENGSGMIVGTPEDAIEAFQQLVQRSGGIGGVLALHHEWASVPAIQRSYELWARYVAPHFQGSAPHLEESRAWFDGSLRTTFAASGAAQAKAFQDAGKDIPEEIAERLRQAEERRAARAAEARAAETDA
ncbi:MAG: LLM class flavin-dependent oxidoreductase, partial [Dehalococcoidia bacterium]